MEKWCTLGLILFIVADVLPYGLKGRGNVISLYKETPAAGMENDSKCHVEGTWLSYEIPYKMLCYQCGNHRPSIVIYHGKQPIQAAKVTTCKHFNVAGSVTILKKYINLIKHKIEYDFRGGHCRKYYYWDGFTSDSDCGPLSYRWNPPIAWSYYNGWQPQAKPWSTGVVRGISSAKYDTSSCHAIGRWKFAYQQIQMRCYNCQEEYIAKIYCDGNSVTAVAVGTCLSDHLVTSIDVIFPKDKEPNTIGVQYKFFHNQCVYKVYTVTRYEVSSIHTREICVKDTLMRVPSLRKYVNGWLQVVV